MAVKVYSKKKVGNVKLSANFKVKEFACKDGSDYILIDDELVSLLQKIRNHFGKSVTINSAYRNATYNKKVGGVSSSQHTKGTAADIKVADTLPSVVAKYVEYIMPKKGGIGLYSTFVHVDTRVKRSRWTNYGKEKVVSGFPGYTEPKKDEVVKPQESTATTKPQEEKPAEVAPVVSIKPDPAKYYVEGITHVVEIDPRNIFAVQTKCKTNKHSYNNFVNGIFFAPGTLSPCGIMVNAGKVISNVATHGKPVATLIVRGANDVEMKYVTDITKEKNVWFAVSGYGVYPKITAADEGFVGKFSDVIRITNRPIIGYRKKDNKIVIAVRSSSGAERAKLTAKNLGLDFAISLDGGGSTTLKVNGKYKFSGDGRKIFGGLIWS